VKLERVERPSRTLGEKEKNLGVRRLTLKFASKNALSMEMLRTKEKKRERRTRFVTGEEG